MSAVAQRKPDERAPIDVIRAQVSTLLPKHVTPERFMRAANLAVAQNPYLLELDRMSLLQSVAKAAELGLTPNTPLGECYLIPFGRKVQMIPGYRGLITLARRSGEVVRIGAHVVYEGEEFNVSYGPQGQFKHVPNLEVEKTAARRFAYAYAVFRDGTDHIEVVPRWKIEKVKADALAKIRDDRRRAESPWVVWEDEMWRKTAIRALFKYLPVSTEDVRRSLERADAIEHEAAQERGELVDFGAIQGDRVEDVTPSPASAPDPTARLGAALDATTSEAKAREEFEKDMAGA